MTFTLVPADLVVKIHDEILNPGELQGLALDKSLEGALARVENRLAYGMIGDVYDLAATYAVAVATGHCLNDANKRTAFRVMQVALWLNGVEALFEVEDTGPLMVQVAQGHVEAEDLAAWLRAQAG